MQLHYSKTAEQLVNESRAAGQPIKATEVMTLVTHFKPHLDEIVAFIIFLLYGNRRFHEIKHVCFDFCRDGQKYRGKTFEENLRDMFLCIGVGGGPLDEHPTITEGRKRNKCAAVLTAEYLSVAQMPELQNLLIFTLKADINQVSDPFHMANCIKEDFREGQTFEQIFSKYLDRIVEPIERNKRFFQEAGKEYARKAQIDNILIDGKSINIASICSDNSHVSSFARSKHGCYAAITIQMNSTGNVQITGNKFYKNIPFENIVAVLRSAEGCTIKKAADWSSLVQDGKTEEVSNWHFASDHPAILNGSESHPDVPPTKLTMEQLRAIVKIALTPELFEKFLQANGIKKA